MPSSPISILAKAGKIVWKPWPHLVIYDALSKDYYRELLETRLSWQEIQAATGRPLADNTRYDLRAAALWSMPKAPKIWKEFTSYHVSGAFWQDLVRVFGEVIRIYHPHFRISEPVGMRGLDRVPIQLDCQMGVNSPAPTESRVVGPHIDNPVALFAGILYMGDQGGGDLQIQQWRTQTRVYKEEGQGHRIPDEEVLTVATVPYTHNTFVGFINMPDAVHAVTPRQSLEPRLLCNFLVDSGHGKIFNKYGRGGAPRFARPVHRTNAEMNVNIVRNT